MILSGAGEARVTGASLSIRAEDVRPRIRADRRPLIAFTPLPWGAKGMTPNSGTAAYITPDQFMARKDIRRAGFLVNDDGTLSTSGQLETSINLGDVLTAASGRLEAACLMSGRYAVADIQAMQGNSQSYMLQLLADIAMQMLYERRGGPSDQSTLDAYNRAEAALELLREGKSIFSFVEVEAAGVPTTEEMSVCDFANENLLTFNWSRAFGVRNTWARQRSI